MILWIHLHLAADIFTIGDNLATRLAALAGAFLILVVGIKALGHILSDHHGLAFMLILVALIPAAFFFDPKGVTAALTSAVHLLGG